MVIGSAPAGLDVYGTDEEGFPLVFWTVLRSLGYEQRPKYLPRNSVEEGVPRCVVNVEVTPPPHRPDLPRIDMEVVGYQFGDTRALTALRALTTFCARCPELVANHPIGLFPPARENDPEWLLRFREAPHLLRQMPDQASALWVRCLNAYYQLHQSLARTTAEMARRTQRAFIHHVERDVRHLELQVEVTTQGDLIRQQEARIAELEEAVVGANAREVALHNQIHHLQGQLDQANDMLEMADEQFLEIEMQQNNNNNNDNEDGAAPGANPGEDEDAVSGMDTEDDMPPLPQPPSPAGSGASVNDLDDF